MTKSLPRSILLAVVLLLSQAMIASIAHGEGLAHGSFHRSLNVSGPVNIRISTPAGHIEVRPGSSGTVEITATIEVNEREIGRALAEQRVRQLEADSPIDQTGNSIRIGRDDLDHERNIWINYVLTVPAETQLRSWTGSGDQTVTGIIGPVDAVTGSGGIKVTNISASVRGQTGSGQIEINVAGNVLANTGSGNIVAENVAGSFEGTSGSGSIHLKQSAVGAVEVRTGSGNVELFGVNGPLVVNASSGKIDVQGQPNGPWELHTSSGSITLRLPPDSAFGLDARTSSGSVTVEHPLTIQGTVRRNDLKGIVRGGGSDLTLTTASGNIRVE